MALAVQLYAIYSSLGFLYNTIESNGFIKYATIQTLPFLNALALV